MTPRLDPWTPPCTAPHRWCPLNDSQFPPTATPEAPPSSPIELRNCIQHRERQRER